MALPGDDDLDPAVEAGEVLAGSRQMRRAAEPGIGGEIHHVQQPLGRRLGDQRPLGDALAALPRADFLGGPLAYFGTRRSEQLVDRYAQRACHLDEDSQGRIRLARFQIGTYLTQTLGPLRKLKCIPINGRRKLQIEVLDCGSLVGVLRGTPSTQSLRGALSTSSIIYSEVARCLSAFRTYTSRSNS